MPKVLRRLTGGGIVALLVVISVPEAAGAQTATFQLPFGTICLDASFHIVPCPEMPPSEHKPKVKMPDFEEEDDWPPEPPDNEDPWHTGFCGECHVNSTSEVWGPAEVEPDVLNDVRLFWERHDDVARRIDDRDRLRMVREATALSPEMRRLVEEARRTSRPRPEP
jgi:hypothetical protein